jgi:hypothetical protein
MSCIIDSHKRKRRVLLSPRVHFKRHLFEVASLDRLAVLGRVPWLNQLGREGGSPFPEERIGPAKVASGIAC